jgi:hypothetical protein
MWFETRWVGGIFAGDIEYAVAAEIGDCPDCGEEVFDPFGEPLEP